jgi:drug/metabolite transporter (DMT)-like permease
MPYIGELSGLLTAFLWSGTSLAFASAAQRIGTLQLNINRMLLASIFLLINILIAGYSFDLSAAQVLNLVVSGLIGLILGDTFLFKAFQYIGARLSMLLMASSPAMSSILAFIFLDEDLSTAGIAGIIVTIAGIAIVVLERKEVPNAKYKISKVGIIYGLLGALGQAGGLIFAKFAFQEAELNAMVATFFRVFSSALIMLGGTILIRRYKNPFLLYRNDPKAFGATLIGTVLGPYLGITFSLVAIANTKVGIAATLMSTMPIIMLPLVKHIYKEDLSWRAVTGAFVAVTGIAILFLK